MIHLSICELLKPIGDDSRLSLANMANRFCLECREMASMTHGHEAGDGQDGVETGPHGKKKKIVVDIADLV